MLMNAIAKKCSHPGGSACPANTSSCLRQTFLITPVILISAYLNCAGWILSALHRLNAAGYSVAVILGVILLWWCKPDFGRVRLRRFAKPFPFLFLCLAALAILGGLLYGPNNYDAMAYRLPRIMHWISQESWHWIHTDFHRVNARATGWEWLAAPIIALAKSYRWLFGINAILFLTLPGLVFSVFTRLGVQPRVAWCWMWLAPTAYCFLLQAGSIANDLICAVYALAAIDFALRAKASGRISEMWLSILSAALMTASKSSTLPLLLPWLLCIWPALPLLKKKIAATAVVVACATGSSLLPISILNYKQCGDWTGLVVERVAMYPSPLHLPSNIAYALLGNLTPPVFPWAKQWNSLMDRVLPPELVHALEKCSERAMAHFVLPEMTVEEIAGWGFGLTILVFLTAGAAAFSRSAAPTGPKRTLYITCILLSPLIAALAMMSKSGLSTAGRMLTPFYILLLPLLLAGRSQSQIVRRRWWRVAAIGSMLVAFVPLIVSPARPLWPACMVLRKMDAEHSRNGLLVRAWNVYSVYGARSNGFAPAIAALPPGIRRLGLVTFDDPEASLWMPFGSRSIEHVTNGDTPAILRAKGIEYILVRPTKLRENYEAWRTRMGLEPVCTIPLALRASDGIVDWPLVRLPKNP